MKAAFKTVLLLLATTLPLIAASAESAESASPPAYAISPDLTNTNQAAPDIQNSTDVEAQNATPSEPNDTKQPSPIKPYSEHNDYIPLVEAENQPEKPEIRHIENNWPQPARFMAKAYRYLLYQKLDIGFRTTRHELKETDKGKPFDGSFIGSIDQLRLLPDESPSQHLVVRYAPIPYLGIGYQTDQLAIRTQTSIPRERRISDRDTDGNLFVKGRMPFVFVRYNLFNTLEPYAEYGKARFQNSFDPDPWWFAEGRREFTVENSKTTYWGFGVGITIAKHLVIDVYTRSIETDINSVYYFRGDNRDPEPFIFPASHRTTGVTAAVRF
ncbi:MAG: hypothetical protein ACNA71_03280 [Kiritimatiellia bacterium]